MGKILVKDAFGLRLLPTVIDHIPMIHYNSEQGDMVTKEGRDMIQSLMDKLMRESGIPKKYFTFDSVPENTDECEVIIFE